MSRLPENDLHNACQLAQMKKFNSLWIIGFSGRSNRRTYLLQTVISYLVMLSVPIYFISWGSAHNQEIYRFDLFAAFGIGLLISLSADVRSLHDLNQPAVFVLIFIVPIIGQFLPLLLLGLPGNKGRNKYGDQPSKFKLGLFASVVPSQNPIRIPTRE
jgi:uncharacterized membrane protein YhaH (DUF805 family)